MNIHTEYINKRIADLRKQDKWKCKLIADSHDEFIKDYSTCVCTNLIKNTFTPAYMKKFKCSDCNGKAQHRCHGIGEERPKLLKRALQRIWPDPTKPIVMKEILIAFLDEHIYTQFTFKCATCHNNEKIFN